MSGEPCRTESVGTPVLAHIDLITYVNLVGLIDTASFPVEQRGACAILQRLDLQ
jgi:hypothetical protein